MSLNARTPEEYDAANFIVRLSNGTSAHAGGSKRGRDARDTDQAVYDTSRELPKAKKRGLSARKDESHLDSEQKPPPRAAPYFFYTDHSREADRDPLCPMTQPGAVPIFPVKMHVLLSKPELSDVLAWDSHGRSFRILKPRQFEAVILPRYFDHANFASFTRQLNGWGFRRLTEGENMGSYYEEHFLRSMPWLCKQMKRPKVGEKISICPRHEPDLVAISKDFPVPHYPPTREIKVVQLTMAEGPKAKVPEKWPLEDEELHHRLPLPNSHRGHVPLFCGDRDDEKKPAARIDRHIFPSSPLASMAHRSSVASAQHLATECTNALNELIKSLQQSGNVGLMSGNADTFHVNAPLASPISSLSIQSLLQSIQQSRCMGSMTAKSYTHQASVPATAVLPSSALQSLLQRLLHSGSVGSNTEIQNTFHSVPATAPQSPTSIQSILQSLQQRGSLGSMTRLPNTHPFSVPMASPLSSILNQIFLQSLHHESGHVGSNTATHDEDKRNSDCAQNVLAPVAQTHATAPTALLSDHVRNFQQIYQVLSMSGKSRGIPWPTPISTNSQPNSQHSSRDKAQAPSSQRIVRSRMSRKDDDAHLSVLTDPSSLPFRNSRG